MSSDHGQCRSRKCYFLTSAYRGWAAAASHLGCSRWPLLDRPLQPEKYQDRRPPIEPSSVAEMPD